MRLKLWLACAALALVVGGARVRGQEMPEMPKPTAEHGKLAPFAGKWKVRSEVLMPGEQEPMVVEGIETARMMGGFWLLNEGESEMMGEKMESQLLVGYDPKAKHYVGTFVCSAGDYMWEYIGKFDDSGKKLVLDTEGPLMMDPTQTTKYRETLELVDADHKTFTSEMQDPDGKWVKIVTMTYERVK
jgi:hypothetical protein